MTMHDLEEFSWEEPDWTVVGVFTPGEERSAEPDVTHRDFCYTVGAGPVELFCHTASIEGREAGHDLVTAILNRFVPPWRAGELAEGDSVTVPLGQPDGPDGDCVFWVGTVRERDGAYPSNMSATQYVLPIRWSSFLGWNDG